MIHKMECAPAAFVTMNTKKHRTEIAFLQWLLYMQIPCNKSGNPSLALCSKRKT